jgi:Putative beta barrel porin-7 (BBP7)
MKMQWAWVLPVLTILASGGTTWGQDYSQGYPQGYQPGSPPPGYAPLQYDPSVTMYAPPGTMPGGQPGYGQPGYGPMGYGQPVGYMQAEGEPTPALLPGGESGALGPMPGAEGYEGGQYGGPAHAEDFGVACPYCGGAGCDRCSGQNGLLGDVLGIIGPYPDGGCGAVRWYDLSIDYMLLKRDNVGRPTNFTSQGIAGPIVLSTNSLGFNESSSFRFTGMFQVGPGSSAEFVYYGLFFHDSEATVTDPTGNLFSVFSNFGTLPFNGFAETDQSNLQAIRYTSKFDNFEANFRQRWVAPSARYQGSWLLGARYFKLDEQFSLNTRSTTNSAEAFYDTDIFNSLTGMQVGGDIWFCLFPGLRIGGEAKAGVYGNHAGQNSSLSTSSGAVFQENADTEDVAFVGDATVMATYRLNYQWTAKLGYHFLYVDGVALASENFNPTPPALFLPPPGANRVLSMNNNGNVFYHGFMAGLEFMW